MNDALEAERLEALALVAEARARRCGRPHEARAVRAAAEALRRRAMELRSSAAGRPRRLLEVVRAGQPDPEGAPGSA